MQQVQHVQYVCAYKTAKEAVHYAYKKIYRPYCAHARLCTYVCRCELELPTRYRVAHAISHTNAALNSAPSISGSTLRLLTEVES